MKISELPSLDGLLDNLDSTEMVDQAFSSYIILNYNQVDGDGQTSMQISVGDLARMIAECLIDIGYIGRVPAGDDPIK